MIIKNFTLSLLSLLLISVSPSVTALQISDYKQLETLFKEVASNTDYTVPQLQTLFEQVEIKPLIIETMDRPAESTMTWTRYRKIFLTEKNISNGAEFWRTNADTLARAEEKFGVPPEIIVATLGVETRYGSNTGNFRVIDALATLALEYPRRSKYFSRELKNFLLLTDEHKLEPLAVTGSYAGAIGLPQFMPSSYRVYAVDFSNDGYSDLVNSIDDAIGSIASYYHEHGWKSGQPVSWLATDVKSSANKLLVKKRKTDRPLNELLQKGFTLQEKVDPNTRVGLIKLEGDESPEYRVAFDNFFVITRYNTSMLYATAVQLLGEEIKSSVQAIK
ncbi:MAG: lytic murein transglycosylase B [Gammaproteobacteria bacterium]